MSRTDRTRQLLLLGALVTAVVLAGSARSAARAPDPVAIDVEEAITAVDSPNLVDAVVPADVTEGVAVADGVAVVDAQVPLADAEGVTVTDAVAVQPQGATAVAVRSLRVRRGRTR